jgi:hypothetical protein
MARSDPFNLETVLVCSLRGNTVSRLQKRRRPGKTFRKQILLTFTGYTAGGDLREIFARLDAALAKYPSDRRVRQNSGTYWYRNATIGSTRIARTDGM